MQEPWVEIDGALAPESAVLEYQGKLKNHPYKAMGKNVSIADSVFFAHPELCSFGDNVRIDGFCSFTTKVTIGNNVHIGPFVSVVGGVKSELIMEDYSGLSAGCRIICGSDNYYTDLANPTIPEKFRTNCVYGKVILHKFAIAGTNTVVHPNVEFAEGVCTGSCSLVTKSLDNLWGVYKGIPVQLYRYRHHIAILLAAEEYERGGK